MFMIYHAPKKNRTLTGFTQIPPQRTAIHIKNVVIKTSHFKDEKSYIVAIQA